MPEEEMGQTETVDTNETVETETESTETEVRDYQEEWQKVAPELADHVKDLSSEAQVGILLKRLAAQPGGANQASDVQESVEPDAQREAPSVPEWPKFDPEQIGQRLQDAVDANDGESAKGVMVEAFGVWDTMAQIMSRSQREIMEQIGSVSSEFGEISRPATIRRVLPEVKGAGDGDVAAASRILKEGEATTPGAALSLAVFRRQQELGDSKAADGKAATRRANGVAAGRISGGSRRAGTPVVRIPQNDGEWKAQLARDEQKKQ